MFDKKDKVFEKNSNETLKNIKNKKKVIKLKVEKRKEKKNVAKKNLLKNRIDKLKD